MLVSTSIRVVLGSSAIAVQAHREVDVMRSVLRARKLWSGLTTRSYWRGFRQGVFPALEHERALRGLSLAFVADVGCNRGQFALVARRLFPDVRIVAFEPLEEPASVFEAVFRDDSGVEIRRTALGAESGPATMYVSRHDDSSSLLSPTSKQTTAFPGTETIETRTVEQKRLDECLRRDFRSPALLKLDVQGDELQVLRGAEALLPSFQYVCAEVSFVELYQDQALAVAVIGYLADRGFGIRSVYNVVAGPAGRSLQCDMLFERAIPARDDARPQGRTGR